jgi:hypothetical protein
MVAEPLTTQSCLAVVSECGNRARLPCGSLEQTMPKVHPGPDLEKHPGEILIQNQSASTWRSVQGDQSHNGATTSRNPGAPTWESGRYQSRQAQRTSLSIP